MFFTVACVKLKTPNRAVMMNMSDDSHFPFFKYDSNFLKRD